MKPASTMTSVEVRSMLAEQADGIKETLARIRDNPYHNMPQPLKRAEDHEFMKTVCVTDRLRTWCDGYSINGGITQAIEDVKWLLTDHLRLFKENESKERAIWYQQDKEDNGNIAISWQERAEDLQAKLRNLSELAWMIDRYLDGQIPTPESAARWQVNYNRVMEDIEVDIQSDEPYTGPYGNISFPSPTDSQP